MNDSKYGRLYPERAVAPARAVLGGLLEALEAAESGASIPQAGLASHCRDALGALDTLGFPPNEPLFLLRGQDELAADSVRQYANYRIEEQERRGLPLDHETHLHLYEFADRMAAWQPRKLPD